MPRICGCEVVLRNHQKSVVGNAVIQYCPLHKAAPDLLRALIEAKDCLVAAEIPFNRQQIDAIIFAASGKGL